MTEDDFYTFEVKDGDTVKTLTIQGGQLRDLMKKARLLVAEEDQAKLLELIEE